MVFWLVFGMILIPNQAAFAYSGMSNIFNLADNHALVDAYSDTLSDADDMRDHANHGVAKDTQHCKQDKASCNQCNSCSFCNYVAGCFAWRGPGPDNFYCSHIVNSAYSFEITTLYRPPIHA